MLRTLAALAVVAAGLAPRADAQCFTPDGLGTAPCWANVTANLPTLPPLGLEAGGFCWNDCDPTTVQCLRMQSSPPAPFGCGRYDLQYEVVDCAGVILLSGTLRLEYTRTWQETDPTGRDYQVWRFVARADLRLGTPGVVDPCLQPSCLPSQDTAFYYGYVDYAQECTSLSFRNAVVLHHQCDFLIHQPGISSKAGAFHPNRSFSLVAPHSTVIPFVPSLMPAPGGPAPVEAVRNVGPAGAVTCITEEKLAGGDVVPIVQACVCPLSFVPPQVTARHLEGAGTCPDPAIGPSSFTTINVFPTFPWLEDMTTSIGCWTAAAPYPGEECAWVDEAAVLYTDSCAAAAGVPPLRAELHYGATTAKGYATASIPPGTPISDVFVDTVSNLSLPIPGPIPLPLVGTVGPADHLIYLNTF